MHIRKKYAKMNKVNRFYVNFIDYVFGNEKVKEAWDGILVGNKEQLTYQLSTNYNFLKQIHMPEKHYFKQFELLPID